jgi:hypothetical protein
MPIIGDNGDGTFGLVYKMVLEPTVDRPKEGFLV